MRKKIFKNIEWEILICTILLILIGLVALFSATQNAEYEELKKQIMWLCISIPIFIAVIFIDYEIVAKASPIFYGIFLILLIAVLFTKSINGATSWFNVGPFSIQPSEFAKIFSISLLASRSLMFCVMPVGIPPHLRKRFQISTEYAAVCSSFKRR